MAQSSFEGARDELYGLDPDEFMSRRTALAKKARDGGDAAAAKKIGALRKPNRSAYAINALVRADPAATDRLADLRERLRAAQDSLDGALMRELSTERNKTVDELARGAFRAASVGSPTAALRDDVVATLNAAIADPEVLDRVAEGALVRPESWSGFGVVAAPALHVVPDRGPAPSAAGGMKAGRKAAAKAKGAARLSAPAKPSAADRAKERREAKIAEARDALGDAEQELRTAQAEADERERAVKRAQEQLRDAQRRLDEAQLEVRRLSGRVDKARSALDRLSR